MSLYNTRQVRVTSVLISVKDACEWRAHANSPLKNKRPNNTWGSNYQSDTFQTSLETRHARSPTITLTHTHTDAHKKTIYTSIHTCLHLIYLYAENCISMKQEFCHISPENFIKNTTLLQLLCTRIRPLEFNAMHHSISQKRKQHTCIATIAVQSFKKSTTCI